jgi:hypothetical protein
MRSNPLGRERKARLPSRTSNSVCMTHHGRIEVVHASDRKCGKCSPVVRRPRGVGDREHEELTLGKPRRPQGFTQSPVFTWARTHGGAPGHRQCHEHQHDLTTHFGVPLRKWQPEAVEAVERMVRSRLLALGSRRGCYTWARCVEKFRRKPRRPAHARAGVRRGVPGQHGCWCGVAFAQEPDPVTGAVTPPISLASTFAQASPGKPSVRASTKRCG